MNDFSKFFFNLKISKNARKYFSLMCVFGLLLFGCGEKPSSLDNADPSTQKAIMSFSLSAANNSELFSDIDGFIVSDNHTISLTVPSGTDITTLVPTIIIAGSSISPASGTATDFTGLVIYTVTAEDGTIQEYTVITRERLVGEPVTYIAGLTFFNMIYVPGGLIFPFGEYDSVTTTVTNDYLIGQTEVTYELWNTVYIWATDTARGAKQYVFANPGLKGNDGNQGVQHPVTTINWRDAMVWTNALTEYLNAQHATGLEPVYTYNGAIIRDSSNANGFACDNVVASSTANGFRLQTAYEWDLAARYITDDGDKILNQTGEYYLGSFASGADRYYNDTGSGDIDGNGVYRFFSDVAVYSASSTAVVKSKFPNALGIYDINGNVAEWVFNWYTAGFRMIRGGSYVHSADGQMIGRLFNSRPYNALYYTGFRLARTY